MLMNSKYTIGCIVGTRPEVIKMAPVVFQLRQCPWANVLLINTAQHRKLLDDMFKVFDLTPDVDLNCMTFDQSLGELTGQLCQKLDILFKKHPIDALLAAGDTTTVFVSALAAFYNKIPFGHIEAGMRSFNQAEPFPEEINRILTAPLATWHFAPTSTEKAHLLKENIAPSNIIITGNPVIDALYWVLDNKPSNVLSHLSNIILVTTHRRENFGANLKNICQALITLTHRFPHLHFVIPVHPNPNVQKDIASMLANIPGIHLTAPMQYDEFAHLMQRSLFVLTDSGGIQEEAAALGKPILILRDITERGAIISQELGLLIGTKVDAIVDSVSKLVTDASFFKTLAKGISPYGDGKAALRIVASLEQQLMSHSLYFDPVV